MTYTPIQNRFWSDGWVRQLNALDRYLFLYLLTNGRAKLTGVYELPLDMLASESGIDEKDLRLSMLNRLEPKVYYKEGWVIIINYLNHRVSNSPKLLAGINKEFEELPKKIQEIALSYGYPIHTVSIPNSVSRNRIEENRRDTGVADAPRDVPIGMEEGRTKKVTPEMQQVFDLFKHNPARLVWKGRVHIRDAAKVLFDTFGIEELGLRYRISQEHKGEEMCPQIDDPSEFLEKMPKMENFLKKL